MFFFYTLVRATDMLTHRTVHSLTQLVVFVHKMSENIEKKYFNIYYNIPEPQVKYSDCLFYPIHSSKLEDIAITYVKEKHQFLTFKKLIFGILAVIKIAADALP